MKLIHQHSFRQGISFERLKKKTKLGNQLNIVITGGTQGLGRSFAEEFLNHNDNVFVLARNVDNIINANVSNMKVLQCNVQSKNDIQNAVDTLLNDMNVNSIDIWINNAGISGGNRSLLELSDEKITEIINTNLIGTCNACKIVHNVMKNQASGGAIFNLAGAGSDGSATPGYPVYGATKAGIVQLTKTLQKEWENTNVDVHLISPGMMLTDLLTDNLHMDTLKVIEFLCSHPDIVALHLVPRIRAAYYKEENEYIRYLTILRILGKVITKVTNGSQNTF